MNSVIIVAGGNGSRMKANMSKQYLTILNKPILAHTIEVFENSKSIDEIILVISKNDEDICKELILDKYKYSKLKKIVFGGDERQASVYNGILALNEKCENVLIHDAVRPIIDENIIAKCIENLNEVEALSTGMPVKETIKIVKGNNVVDMTPDRCKVWTTQTPQAFKKNLLKKAHEFTRLYNISGTDDAMLVEKIGVDVKMIEGSYDNIKLTTPEDLIIAESILKKRKG